MTEPVDTAHELPPEAPPVDPFPTQASPWSSAARDGAGGYAARAKAGRATGGEPDAGALTRARRECRTLLANVGLTPAEGDDGTVTVEGGVFVLRLSAALPEDAEATP